MPLQSYECLFLLDPTKAATDLDAIRGQLHGTLEKYGAQIVASRKWDDRKLAYPIKGHKKGIFYLTYFKMDSRKVAEADHDFRLNEVILRHLVSHVDPKWADEMEAVAKDDHRFALQIIRDESPEGGAGPAVGGLPGDINMPSEEGGGDARSRRGPRRGPDGDGGKE